MTGAVRGIALAGDAMRERRYPRGAVANSPYQFCDATYLEPHVWALYFDPLYVQD